MPFLLGDHIFFSDFSSFFLKKRRTKKVHALFSFPFIKKKIQALERRFHLRGSKKEKGEYERERERDRGRVSAPPTPTHYKKKTRAFFAPLLLFFCSVTTA